MEAMSVGAVVITVDGEPMNELVDATTGVLVTAARTGTLGLARSFHVAPAAVEQAVEQVLAMAPAERAALGQRARTRFEDGDAAFRAGFAAATME